MIVRISVAPLLVVASLVFTAVCYGYKLRCTKKQDYCEVVTKRLTTGDYLAIVDQEGYLSAMGKVVSIKKGAREIKILKKFNKIRSSHKALLIKDEEFNNPREHFFILEDTNDGAMAGEVSLINMGVGQSASAIAFGGYQEWPTGSKGLSYVARGFLLTGSGKASATNDQFVTEKISFTSLGALGGLRLMFRGDKSESIRMEGALGGAYMSAATDGSSNFKDLVDGRIFNGFGSVLKLGLDILFRWDDKRPYFGFSLTRLQNSLDYGLHAGLAF